MAGFLVGTTEILNQSPQLVLIPLTQFTFIITPIAKILNHLKNIFIFKNQRRKVILFQHTVTKTKLNISTKKKIIKKI